MADRDTHAPVIAIDGPGGSGKGTIALRLARDLGWHLLDSGALYRLVAVAAMDRGIAADDEEALGQAAARLDADFAADRVGDEALLMRLVVQLLQRGGNQMGSIWREFESVHP